MSGTYRTILLLGAPGSGKGTQSRALAQLPGFYRFGTGEALRKLDPESELGSQVQPYLCRGDLVPNELVMKVWQSHLRGAEQAGEFSPSRDIVLLDAFPRDKSQAKLLEPQVEMQLVIYLRAAEEEALKERVRQRNQRPDDQSDQVIEHRFQIFHQQTLPLMETYDRSRVVEIEAIRPPLLVLAELAKTIDSELEKEPVG